MKDVKVGDKVRLTAKGVQRVLNDRIVTGRDKVVEGVTGVVTYTGFFTRVKFDEDIRYEAFYADHGSKYDGTNWALEGDEIEVIDD
jgi:hypothetical protein